MNQQPSPPAKVAIEQALSSTMTDKRIEVLRAVGQFGSISQAARATDVSYKAAWQAIETLGNLAGVPLIDKAVGGSGGGGARLTNHGLALLQAADRLNEAKAIALAQIQAETSQSYETKENKLHLSGMGLRTSMRNQLPCKVHAIEITGGMARIWLELGDGQHLASKITSDSLELLDLKQGQPVLALCKATAVTIAPSIVAMGEINILKGRITKRLGLKRDGQLSMAVGPNLQLSGFIQAGADLKLKQTAMAAIAESAVVIALND